MNLLILKGDNPFTIENFKQVASRDEREAVLNSNEPAIILSTSGMLNGGASVEYFKRMASNENNAIVFVGYQAVGTLGRRVKDGEKSILLNNTGSSDDRVEVKMRVEQMKGAFSAHSDLNLTKKFISNLSVKPRKVILNHGEISKIQFFSGVVSKLIPGVRVYTPENLDSIRLN